MKIGQRGSPLLSAPILSGNPTHSTARYTARFADVDNAAVAGTMYSSGATPCGSTYCRKQQTRVCSGQLGTTAIHAEEFRVRGHAQEEFGRERGVLDGLRVEADRVVQGTDA
eukprot:195690-Rhodomonas_salina.1